MLRFLLVLLGVGIGLAAAQLGVELYRTSNPEKSIQAGYVILSYASAALVGGLILLLLSNRIIRWVSRLSILMQRWFVKMPMNQLISSVTGLVLGLIVAALLRQMLAFVGPGVFTTALNAILYLTLGALGFSIGRKKSRELTALVLRFWGAHEKSKSRKQGFAAKKYVDTSAIIDGRVLEIAKTGFLEGELIIPQFVVDELRQVADSPDESKRERGRHGLDILAAMQEQLPQLKIDEADEPELQDVDVKLLRQAKEWGGAVITVDYNLQKAAAVSSIRTLNVNELVEALRPAVTQGMEMQVRIIKEGKENNQGIGYLNDGTMIVVEEGKMRIGETVQITVSSILQTSAGRMIFAKIR